MSDNFGKIFSSCYTGSMMGAGEHVHSLWPYILASKDEHGDVEVNPLLVAVLIGTTPERIQAALDYLMAPDPQSKSNALEGRRLIRTGMFAYQVVNNQAYKIKGKTEEQAAKKLEYDKKYQEQRRLDEKAKLNYINASLNNRNDSHDIVKVVEIVTVESESESESKAEQVLKQVSPVLQEQKEQAPAVPPTTVVGIGSLSAEDQFNAIQKFWNSKISGGNPLPACTMGSGYFKKFQKNLNADPNYGVDFIDCISWVDIMEYSIREKTPDLAFMLNIPTFVKDSATNWRNRDAKKKPNLPPPPTQAEQLLIAKMAEENRLEQERAAATRRNPFSNKALA